MPLSDTDITLDDSERTPCEGWKQLEDAKEDLRRSREFRESIERKYGLREEQDGWVEPKKQYESAQ